MRRILQIGVSDDGTARVPRQGQGKKDDVRWHFAGPKMHANLRELERVRGSSSDDTLLSETFRDLQSSSFMASKPAFSTVCAALHNKCGYTSKRLSGRAYERDDEACEAWFARFHGKYTAEQIVCVDETCAPGPPGRRARPGRCWDGYGGRAG